jgi:hypothetical protein
MPFDKNEITQLHQNRQYMSVMLEPQLPEPVTRQKERYTNGELVSIWYE